VCMCLFIITRSQQQTGGIIFSHLTDFPVFPVCTLLHCLFPFFNEFYYVCVLLQPVREEVESRTERTVSGK